MRQRLSDIRVPLGMQFFAAAVVMGVMAIVMAVSTIGGTQEVETALDDVVAVVESAGDATSQAGLDSAREALAAERTRGLILALIVAAIGVGAATFLTITISSASKKLAATAKSIAAEDLPAFASAIARLSDGDLTVSYQTTTDPVDCRKYDEIGDIGIAFNEMIASIGEVAASFTKTVETLRGIVAGTVEAAHQVRDGSEILASSSDESARAATQVATSISSIAEGAESQVRITDDVSETVAQIVTEVETAGNGIKGVSTASEAATAAAQEGQAQIDGANEAMEAIKTSFDRVAETVNGLGAHSEKVEEIVDLIRSIAAQTNLLALNAAIEAARAGEMGRGFAVVASEVKSLAEESAKSTEQIAEIVGQMRGSVHETVEAMTGGHSQVESGSQIVSTAGAAFGDITGVIGQIRTQVAAVEAATARIEAAAYNIEGGTGYLVEVTEANSVTSEQVAAAAEEAAATSEEIGATAQQLKMTATGLEEAISRFTT
ncbi:MAG: methyl-accepting chemotaxis protein [Acidimicrobiia bacterium]